jgi:recombination protein RecT
MGRAALYFATRPELENCTRESKVEAILGAAELGLPLDGRNAHVVPYRNKEIGKTVAELQVDYKGFIAVARRAGLVDHVVADVVREGDSFAYWLDEEGQHYKHSHGQGNNPFKGNRGEIIGAFAQLHLPDGRRKLELMDREELDKARAVAKTDKVWRAWPGEMSKKTVIRRALKPYSDEPRMSKAFDLDDAQILRSAKVAPVAPGRAEQLSFESLMGEAGQAPGPKGKMDAGKPAERPAKPAEVVDLGKPPESPGESNLASPAGQEENLERLREAWAKNAEIRAALHEAGGDPMEDLPPNAPLAAVEARNTVLARKLELRTAPRGGRQDGPGERAPGGSTPENRPF